MASIFFTCQNRNPSSSFSKINIFLRILLAISTAAEQKKVSPKGEIKFKNSKATILCFLALLLIEHWLYEKYGYNNFLVILLK